ncbi:MAG TPA: M57 family metalloprotease, partial [Gemmataceae bacterium]|nr:M57 family metalloprotease [Gemmataceae bacterium]
SDSQGATTSTSGARAVDFVNDAINTTKDNIFNAGGSKDISGIQQGPWLWTNSKPQGKDDIVNAAAALYTEPSGDLTKYPNPGDVILYAMVDRYDNSGDATMGFWFFVNPIGLQSGKKNSFTGSHSTGFFDANGDFHGDILVIADFTQGGSVSTPTIYGWVGDDATGSLQLFGTPSGKAVVEVNSGPITVPWNYVNKSGATKPDHGEFMEVGVNLTSLGLSSCFTSFLAETRSSQSPTATLSDFVLGPNFQTCLVTLTNQASVKADNFNNGKQITSSQVVITITDGSGLQATSSGPGAAPSVLTDAQLQPLLAQAVNYWRAAGISDADLHALDNVKVQFTSLSGGELGLEAPGHIWIDSTAAGWGWSVAGGQMDLSSVLTHEVGHALGFEHSDTGVMEAALAPGSRLLPEALTSSGTIGVSGTSAASAVSSGVPASTASSRTAEPARVPQVSPSRTDIPEGAFVAAGRDISLSTAAGALQNSSGILRNLPGVLVNPGQQSTLILSTAAADPGAAASQDFSSILVPGLWPALLRLESGSDTLPADEAQDAGPPAWLPPRARPAATPLDLGAEDSTEMGLRQRACDACFADGSWRLDEAGRDVSAVDDSGTAPDSATAAVAFAVVLGSYWGTPRGESERRTRRRFLI